MYCARLDHFVRFNADGSIGKCGHMIGAPGFRDWNDMQQSGWLTNIRTKMDNDAWPQECKRCQQTEIQHGHSIRLSGLERHKILARIRPDYLILGGILDNVCNSACQSCNENLSTKIGSLRRRDYVILDNSGLFGNVPFDRVLEIDLNGGEPTASPRYQHLLDNLPDQLKILRINTNGSRLLHNIESVLDKGIHVIVTISLDGTERVHDYVRWPVRWIDFCKTVSRYRELSSRYKNLELQAWTTLHALNLRDFNNIKQFAKENDLKHDWSYLERPSELNVKFNNSFTCLHKSMAPEIIAVGDDNQSEIERFVADQDRLRGINIKEYL